MSRFFIVLFMFCVINNNLAFAVLNIGSIVTLKSSTNQNSHEGKIIFIKNLGSTQLLTVKFEDGSIKQHAAYELVELVDGTNDQNQGSLQKDACLSTISPNVTLSTTAGGLKVLSQAVETAKVSEETQAINELVELMKPFIKTLNRPVFTYNYSRGTNSEYTGTGYSFFDVADPRSGVPKSEDPRVIKILKKNVESFWTYFGDDNGTPDVSGLYVADEPFSSRTFGGDEPDQWVLARIELPKGHRFLDLESADKKHDRVAFRAALAKSGCERASWLDPDKLFRKNATKHSAQCQEIAQKVIQKLNIDSLFYEWGSGSFQSSSKHRNAAMVIVKSDFFSPHTVRVFTSKLPNGVDPDREERLILKKLGKDLGEPPASGSQLGYIFSLKHGAHTGDLFWPDLKEESNVNIGEWETKYLFGVGNYPEDQI